MRTGSDASLPWRAAAKCALFSVLDVVEIQPLAPEPECRARAESGPTRDVSCRTGVRAIAGIPLRARNCLRSRKRKTLPRIEAAFARIGGLPDMSPAIFNFFSGVAITGASGTVTNGGTISVSGGGYGVHLGGGGAVTNSGIVTGGEDGVLIEGAPGQINNTGAISASVDDGAALFAGGTITNSATGSIQGSLVGPIAAGVFIKGGSGNLQNDGVVIGNKFGVDLSAGGSVTNGAGNPSANISAVGSVGVSGTSFGIFAGNSATVTNYGTIDGGLAAGSEGAELDQGGNVTNHSGGTIRGTDFGLVVTGNSAATVTNAGAISGTMASVEFFGTGANTLTLQTGSTLTGDAKGSTASGATNALVLQGNGTANNNFDNFNTLDVQANASWTLGGDSTFGATTVSSGKLVVAGDLSSGPATLGDPAGDLAQLMIASTGSWDILDDSGIGLGSSPSGGRSGNGNGNGNGGGNGNGNGNGGGNGSFISNSGLFEKTGGSGTSAIAPQLLNKGTVLVSAGTLDLEGAVSGKGMDRISGGSTPQSASTLEFDSTVGGGQTVDFLGGDFSRGALDLIDPQGFSGKIAGFASLDTVQLAGDWTLSSFSETGNGMMGNLTLSSGGTTNTFHFLGDYTANDFSIASGATTIIGHT
jgi:hypothetical protein